MIELRETQKGVILKIRVSPKSNEFKIKGFDSWNNSLVLSTKKPARRGKANKEIERELGRIFGKNVQIISGMRSKNKTVLVQESKEKVLRVLEQLVA